MGEIAIFTCAAMACRKEVLANSNFAWVMRKQTRWAFVACTCVVKMGALVSKQEEDDKAELYGPSENEIPVVVNLLHSSSRFLAAPGCL